MCLACRRYSISAEVCDSKQDEKRVLVYSSHLEVFCGPIVRLFQFSELFQDCWTNLKFCPRQIILGDLNTMRTGYITCESLGIYIIY